jgi:hypothetical protein
MPQPKPGEHIRVTLLAHSDSERLGADFGVGGCTEQSTVSHRRCGYLVQASRGEEQPSRDLVAEAFDVVVLIRKPWRQPQVVSSFIQQEVSQFVRNGEPLTV